MFKKTLRILFSAVTVINLVGCSSNNEGLRNEQIEVEKPATTTSKPITTTESPYSEYMDISLGEAKTKYYDVLDEWEVIVEVSVYNSTSKETEFSPEYQIRAYQNGVECTEKYSIDYDTNRYFSIRPGASTTFYYCFEPKDVVSDVEVVVYGDYGDKELSVNKYTF